MKGAFFWGKEVIELVHNVLQFHCRNQTGKWRITAGKFPWIAKETPS